jgi:GNAT superfamily N-acetyltransferase
MKPPSRLVIRRPEVLRFSEEAAAVSALYLASRRATLPWLREVHTDDETHAWMRDTVFARQSVRLALLRDEIVGFAARDGVWLTQLWVKTGWTGHGIGQQLLDTVLADAVSVTPVLRVYTFQRNAGARRFYERNGFVLRTLGDGTGNEEGEPDVLYERALRG